MALEQGTPMDVERIPGWHLAQPRKPLGQIPLSLYRPTTPVHPLRAAREGRRMFQHDLANQIGTTTSCVSLWESGQRLPHVRQIPRLAKALDVPVDVALSWFVA